MGIKGNVQRNRDGHIIHTNCDTDVIVAEEPPMGSTAKPAELYDIIERFCLGRRWVLVLGAGGRLRGGVGGGAGEHGWGCRAACEASVAMAARASLAPRLSSEPALCSSPPTHRPHAPTSCPRRRLELFGEEHNIRDGWVTVGRNLPTSNFRPNVYASHFKVGSPRSAARTALPPRTA